MIKAFSPGCNQHGKNHWPVMRIVVFHDVFSGLALRPSWGAMYGDTAVSEQALAEQSLEGLPREAVVLGDGNFGIFAFAYAVGQSQRPMILRLTKARAQKVLGSELVEGTDQKVIWRASRWDRDAHPELPQQYQQRLDRMLRCAAQGKLPNRSQRRSYPRAVWGRGGHFPTRKRTMEK